MKIIFTVSFPGMQTWITLSSTSASTPVGTSRFEIYVVLCSCSDHLILMMDGFTLEEHLSQMVKGILCILMRRRRTSCWRLNTWEWEGASQTSSLETRRKTDDTTFKHNIHTGERNKHTEPPKKHSFFDLSPRLLPFLAFFLSWDIKQNQNSDMMKMRQDL